MSTIVTRLGKGSALSFLEADNNWTNLNTDKLENVSEDLTPTLGGDLDVNNNKIRNANDGIVRLGNGGTDGVIVDGSGGVNVKNGNVFTDTTNGSITLSANGTGQIVLNSNVSAQTDLTVSGDLIVNTNTTLNGLIDLGSTGYLGNHREVIYEAGSGSGVSGTYNPAATSGPIHYLALVGNITINGFTNGKAGETVTMLIDSNTVLGSYTLTLGPGILTPGGTAALTPGGFDLLTMTLVDPVNGLYVATIVNDFQ